MTSKVLIGCRKSQDKRDIQALGIDVADGYDNEKAKIEQLLERTGGNQIKILQWYDGYNVEDGEISTLKQLFCAYEQYNKHVQNK